MKKKLLLLLLLLLTACLCLTIAGCGSSSSNGNTDNSNSKSESQSVKPKKSDLMIVSENLKIYNDSLGDPHAIYTAELRNDSNATISVKDLNIDVESEDGSVLTSNSFISVYPNVISPGESAYICEEVANIYADEGLNFDLIDKAVLTYDVEDESQIDSLDTEFSNLSINNNDGEITLTGKIKNKGKENLSEVCIGIPVRDSKGVLQTFIFTFVENLDAGDETDFEQLVSSADPSMDFSDSSMNDAFSFIDIGDN